MEKHMSPPPYFEVKKDSNSLKNSLIKRQYQYENFYMVLSKHAKV
jgi:hypothetical protein